MVMELEKATWMVLLFDFYGNMLTKRQREFMELYYERDLSLGEIASKYEISRQAVHDTLKRAENALLKYEQKLGLAARYKGERANLARALELLRDCAVEEKDSRIREVERILTELINMVTE